MIHRQLHGGLDVGNLSGEHAVGFPSEAVGKPKLHQIHLGALEAAISGAEGRSHGTCLDDAECLAGDPAVQKVSVNWADADERVLIATLDGHLIMDHRPMTRLTAQVTATKDGETQSGYSNIAARQDYDWYTTERIDKSQREYVLRQQLEAIKKELGEDNEDVAGEYRTKLAEADLDSAGQRIQARCHAFVTDQVQQSAHDHRGGSFWSPLILHPALQVGP